MRGTRIFTRSALALLLGAAAALAQPAPDYFPLQTGNNWVYRATGGRIPGSPVVISVGETTAVGGQTYFQVSFNGRELLLRRADSANIVLYDRNENRERLWLPFEGMLQNVETAFDQCSRTASIASREARVQTEFGTFSNALEIRFQPNCADAGTTVAWFLPWIGMVKYEQTTIAGPVVRELVYSRTGFTNIEHRTNAFEVSVDAQQYSAGVTNQGLARLTLRTTQPITLTFPSGQTFDLRLWNERGQIVYTWSADKLFTQAIRHERIVGERTWVLNFPTGNLPPGRYLAEAWLTTEPKQYIGVVSFHVAEPPREPVR